MGNACSSKPRAIANSQYYIETLEDPQETKNFNKARILEYKGRYDDAIAFYN